MQKNFFYFIALVLLSLAFTACEKNGTAAIDYEKPFVATYPADFAGIAPLQDVGASTKQVLRNMNEGIYKYDTAGDLRLGLAEKIDITAEDDILVFDITLKSGLTFHNGSACTAEDVAYSYKRLAGLIPEIPDGTLTGVGNWPKLLPADDPRLGIEVLDDLHVVCRFSGRFGVLGTMHAMADGFLVPSDYPETEQQKHPIGIGPYKFVSYDEGSKICFTRFDDYYGEKPEVKNAEFRKYADSTTIPLAFESGDVDLMSLDNQNYPLYTNKGLYIDSSLSNMVRVLYFNMREGHPFADKNLRLAVEYAVDKRKMNQALTDGRGTILYTHFTPFLQKYYNADLKGAYDYNLTKAKEYLAKSSYKGEPLVIKTVAENAIEQDMVSLIIEDLKALGIKATNDPIPWSNYYTEVYRGRDFELCILNVVGYPDPSRILDRYASTAGGNSPGLVNAEYDKILTECQKATDQNDAEVIQKYKRLQQILTDEAVGVFTVDPGEFSVLSAPYEGYKNYPFAFCDISTIKYKK